MKYRWFDWLSLMSLALLLLTIGCLGLAPYADPQIHSLSLAPCVHISVTTSSEGPVAGELAVFNSKEYGPYRGSLIGFYDENGNIYPALLKQVSWGPQFGIYYRYFRWSDATLWTFTISLCYPLAIFSVLPGIWLARARSKALLRHGVAKLSGSSTREQ